MSIRNVNKNFIFSGLFPAGYKNLSRKISPPFHPYIDRILPQFRPHHHFPQKHHDKVPSIQEPLYPGDIGDLTP